MRAASHGPARALGAAAIVAVPPWLFHGVREDLPLMRVAGARPTRVMAAEYAALVAPAATLVAVGALTGGAPWAASAALVPLASAFVCARTRPGGLAARRTRRGAPRRASATTFGALRGRFELRRGLRIEGATVALVLTLAIGLSAVPVVPALAVLVTAVGIAQWYGAIDEDWLLVVAAQREPRAFVRAKIGGALGAFAAMALPLAALTVARTPAAWLAPTLAVAGGAVVVVAAILLKYARYVPGRRAPAVALLGSVTMLAALVVPPLAAWLLHRWWRGALRTLAPYLAAGRHDPAPVAR